MHIYIEKESDIIFEIIKRQLGHTPNESEYAKMKELPSVKPHNVAKTEKALLAIQEVYDAKTLSWYDGQWIRNKEKLFEYGVYYRGNFISKEVIFSRARKIAKSLYANGVKKGVTFAAAVSNLPDLITTLLGTSYIGAQINIIDCSFAPSYLGKIINSCDANLVFCSDDQYESLRPIIQKIAKIKKIVMLSLADHLPNEFPDWYKYIPKELYRFSNRAKEYRKLDEKIVLIDDFIWEGNPYSEEEVKDKDPNIYDVFTITYSSGTSNALEPKAIPHNVLSYLMMMRFHDEDMMGLPKSAKLNDIIGLAHIPPISDTNVKSVISDTLSQGSIVACEPIYGADTFIYSLIMNRPNFCDATLSCWIEMAKQVFFNDTFNKIDLSFLVLPLSVGGPLEINERRFIDKAFEKTQAGRSVLKKWKLPLPHTFLGEGGGRTESGGIVYTILQGLLETATLFKLKKHRYGMVPTLATDVAIIDRKGNECKVNQYGEMCADSPCSMSNHRYYFDTDNNEDYFLTDNYGRLWPRFHVYAYRNELGNIIMKGRMGSEFIADRHKIPGFIINDIVLADRRRVLSSEVLNYHNVPIVDLELNPLYMLNRNVEKEIIRILVDTEKRLSKALPNAVSRNVVYRVRNNSYKYPQSHCAKRDTGEMLKEGFHNCVKPVRTGNTYTLQNVSENI